MKTFTVTYRESNGRYVDRVVEANDRRDAFKIAQRHHVNPVQVIEGGTLPTKDGDIVIAPHTPGRCFISEPKPWWKRVLFWR